MLRSHLAQDISLIITPPLSLPVKNVAAYMAGDLLRKIPIDNCNECSDQLLLPQLPSPYDELSIYEFLRNKTYQEAGALVYPTLALAMVQYVQSLENLFCAIFEAIVYMPFVLTRLCKSAEKEYQFLTCREIKCILGVQKMGKLYMKVQIFHALNRGNEYNKEDKFVKCNMKMLKLRHL